MDNGIKLLTIFIVLRLLQQGIERILAYKNRAFYSDSNRLQAAAKTLKISEDDLSKTMSYCNDKYKFGSFSSWMQLLASLLFLSLGGFGWLEAHSMNISQALFGGGSIATGLVFFALLGLISLFFGLPFEAYYTFKIEEKHGFNRQNAKGFIGDKIKGLLLGALLGGPLLAAILWIMEQMGTYWWIYAWLLVFLFSLVTVWIYPTLLAPLFNKFTPVEKGELKDAIDRLADKISFQADGISIMDASRRSSHGNAYFTGVFGKKKIVLFDTLVKSMSNSQIVAVLAHELGHFKLNHVRTGLIRSFFVTGLTFFAISYFLPQKALYEAFHFQGVTNYAALVVFSMWFGLLSFIIQPIGNMISRRNEFAADAFAIQNIDKPRELSEALLKLRENSHAMPISHPIYSAFYHSHPPLLERLGAMNYKP
jgi:STE24 endopeptidase